MLTVPILGLLAGIAIVSLLGILSARSASTQSKDRAKQRPRAIESIEIKPRSKSNEELGRNQDNPDAMALASGVAAKR